MAEGRGGCVISAGRLGEGLPVGIEQLSQTHVQVPVKGTAKYKGPRQGTLGRFKGGQKQQSGRTE